MRLVRIIQRSYSDRYKTQFFPDWLENVFAGALLAALLFAFLVVPPLLAPHGFRQAPATTEAR